MSKAVTFGSFLRPIVGLQCLYILLKINGLLSFNFYNYPPHTSPSFLWNLYSIVYTVFICIAFANSISEYVLVPLNEQLEAVTYTKASIYIVFTMIVVVSVEKSNFFYVYQYRNRKKLVKLINDGFELRQRICALCPDDTLLVNGSTKSIIMFKAKLFGGVIQLLICIFGNLAVKQQQYKLEWIYSHLVGTFISTSFFCSVFVLWQFYLILNRKLRRCMDDVKIEATSTLSSQMRMQRYCTLSDDIDRLANLYDRCLKFTAQVNGYFSAPLFLTISYAFAVILTQLFFIYGNLVQIVVNQPIDWCEIAKDFWFAVFYIMEVYFIIGVSNELINEGRLAGTMLYSSVRNIDDRLNRSVSKYSFTLYGLGHLWIILYDLLILFNIW